MATNRGSRQQTPSGKTPSKATAKAPAAAAPSSKPTPKKAAVALGPDVTREADGALKVRMTGTAGEVEFLADNAALATGDVEAAIRSLEAALAAAPRDPAIHNNLGQALARAGRYQEAVDACSRAIALSPQARFFGSRAELHFETGDLEQALADIDEALELEGGDTAAHHMLRGLLCYECEEYEEAVAELEAARELDAALPDLHFHLGKALLRMDRLEEADKAFSTDIRSDGDGAAMSYYNRHVTRQRMGKAAAARKDLDAAIARDAENPAFFRARAKLCAAQGQLAQAEADWDAVVRLAPDEGEYVFERGRFHFGSGRMEEAVRDFSAALELEADSVSCLKGRAAALCSLGRTVEALTDFDLLVELAPDDATLLSNRGYALELLGRHAEALRDYDASLELDPDYAQARFNRAALRTKQKDVRGAQKDYEQLARLGQDVSAELAALGGSGR